MNITSLIPESNIIFVVSGLIGMVCHYVKKYAKNETSSSFKGYFGRDNLNATINTFGAFGMAILGALSSGIITPQMTVWAVLYAGLTTGWAVDSGFNGGNEPMSPPAV